VPVFDDQVEPNLGITLEESRQGRNDLVHPESRADMQATAESGLSGTPGPAIEAYFLPPERVRGIP
jgi:hypothetical protein